MGVRGRPPWSLVDPFPGLRESQCSPNLASHPPDAAETIIVRRGRLLEAGAGEALSLVGGESGRLYQGTGCPLFFPRPVPSPSAGLS